MALRYEPFFNSSDFFCVLAIAFRFTVCYISYTLEELTVIHDG